ncbi:MAG: glycosyltransferase family 2 protein [Armatimonadetes bacterium]|nr:glycosyltransferase family 2 protein [Armatimonadota bacterium]
MKLSLLIPAHNEAATLEEVIRRIRAVPLPVQREIVMVDDGSTDATSEILKRLSGPDLCVVRHPKNRGKGAALRTGLEYCTGDYILIHDADLEYFPEDIPKLLEAEEKTGAAAVYGSRFQGEIRGMRPINRLANRLLAWAATLLYGQRITDEATAYKLFRAETLKGLPLRCERFEFCPEVTAKLLKSGERIVEVPIRYAGRTAEEGKKITWRDGVEAFWTLLKYRFRD